MKHTHACLFVAGALMGNCAFIAKAGYPDLWYHEAAASNLVLEIATDTNRYTPRDPLILHVSLRNEGTTTVITTISDPLEYLTFDLKDDRGEEVPMTRWTKHMLKREKEGRISTSSRELAPGTAEEFAVRLNAAFDLSKPCVYTLQVCGSLFSGEKPPLLHSTNRLCSNAISFEMDVGWEQIARSRRVGFSYKNLKSPYLLPKRDEDNRLR